MSVVRLPAPTQDSPLLAWLLEAMPNSPRSRIKEWLRSGFITINGESITQFDHPLRPGDQVIIDRTPRLSSTRTGSGLAVVYEDDSLIVLDKPPGLLTVSTPGEKHDTAFARLSTMLTNRNAGRPHVVHRLDRDTSGVVLFARTLEIRDRLQANWSEVTKLYLAVVAQPPEPAEGVIESHVLEGRDFRVRTVGSAVPGAQYACSRYRVVQRARRFTLVEVELTTGRKHQIRVHLASVGSHVVGDEVYGGPKSPADRLGLHAYRLAFTHPITGQPIVCESPLPHSLRSLVT